MSFTIGTVFDMDITSMNPRTNPDKNIISYLVSYAKNSYTKMFLETVIIDIITDGLLHHYDASVNFRKKIGR
jgi:hypothetical protein